MTKEEAYDAEIAPLMEVIIRICQQHKIALLASYCLGAGRGGADLMCTTALLSPEFDPAPGQLAAVEYVGPGPYRETVSIRRLGKNPEKPS